MSTINVDFTKKGGSKKDSSKAKDADSKGSFKKLIICLVGTVLGGAITYYFMLPPLNFKSLESYIFVGIILAIYAFLTLITSGEQLTKVVGEGNQAYNQPEIPQSVKKKLIVPGVIAIAMAAVVIVGFVSSAQILRAKSYRDLLPIDETKTFSDNIDEADWSTVPVLDRETAAVLANRTLGDLASIGKVSQFEVSYAYNQIDYQINYKNKPYKVIALEYGDIFKWFKNTGSGLPGYIKIDMVTQKAQLVTLQEGEYMKYSPSEHFSKYLMRHVQFAYPTNIFDTPRFEIDEEGKPYWICPVLDKTIGLFGGNDIKGIVVVDAVTGEMNEYSTQEVIESEELNWIDCVYSKDLLISQYNFYGKYINGFINSILGQEGVKVATEGSNFIAIDGDIYLYTGVTSSGNDQAIIGFVLMNMRTKDANFYEVSGAKELSAMSSAQGEVQNYAYQATFPILLNVSGQPTYFMALKDADNLIRMYSMVSVQHYQVAVTGDTIAECMETYVKELEKNNIKIDIDLDEIKDATDSNNSTDSDTPEVEKITATGKITQIRTAVMAGESVFFIELDGKGVFYNLKASDAPEVVILNVGDSVSFEHEASEDTIIDAQLVVE